MTPLVRMKTGEAVASHILGLLFNGTLRSGDRIDLDRVATTLGVSRVPVREGLQQLERDGLVHLPHYRGAFVTAFDPGTIREAFGLYGMLSSLTNSRAAELHDAGMLETLGKLTESLTWATRVDEFESLAREFRKTVNIAVAGPHLRALLRSFGGLVPVAARFSIEDAMDDERAALRREYDALVAADGPEAAAAALDHVMMTCENAVRALQRRGVFNPGQPADGDRGADRRETVLGIVQAVDRRPGKRSEGRS